jgi:SAM-dependent methyltransferase
MVSNSGGTLSRQYVRLCNRGDFEDPELRAMLRDVMPRPSLEAELHRKCWEFAMLGLYLEEVGALKADAEALGVAAGHEPPLFWLTNRIGRMVATDIYGQGSFAGREAPASMLDDPSAFAPYPYRADRLEVRHMDALALEYPDASFDIVFCLSSIEHFAGPQAASRAALEMGRVLRPGGSLVITTECFVGRHPLNSPKAHFAIRLATLGRRCAEATPTRRVIEAYTRREIERLIVAPLAGVGVEMVQPLDLSFSDESRENLIRWSGAGELRPATGSPYPHILLQAHGSPWTSIFLAFRKRP